MSKSRSAAVKLLFVSVLLLASTFFMALISHVVDLAYYEKYCAPERPASTPLWDLFETKSKSISEFLFSQGINRYEFSDRASTFFYIPVALILLLNQCGAWALWRFLMRVLPCMSLNFFIRAFSLITTILPSYHGDLCGEMDHLFSKSTNRSFLSAVLMRLLAPFTRHYALADYMYSGHASTSAIMLWQAIALCDRDCPWYRLKFLSLLIGWAVSIFAIILSRLHYTADVFIGIIVAFFVCTLHRLFRGDAALHGFFISRFLRWLEE